MSTHEGRPDGVYLETARLVLRRFTEADADALVDLDSDPEVMHFITGGRTTPRAEIEADVLPAFLDYYRHGADYGFWAAIERDTGQFVGWFHLRPEPSANPDSPELGYRLRREAWGRGLATQGARALIDTAFTHCRAQRVLASTMAVHTASRRVMERAGMTLLRRFHQDWPYPIAGDTYGDVEYVIERSTWQSRQPP